jgi:hypothetical protein
MDMCNVLQIHIAKIVILESNVKIIKSDKTAVAT